MSNEALTVAATEQVSHSGDVVSSVGVRRELFFVSAAELKEYTLIQPDAANRFLTLFEEQTRHRMAMEERSLENERNAVQVARDRLQVELDRLQAERARFQDIAVVSKLAIEADQNNKRHAVRFGAGALLGFILLAVFFALMGMEWAAIVSILVPGIQCIGDWIEKLTRERKNSFDDSTHVES